MQIIPVIDLKDGVVVRGIGGRRDEYRPIASQLTKSSQPAVVAETFVQMGLSTIYVADLDAIAQKPPAIQHYDQIRSAGAMLWIDAGINSVTRAHSISEWADRIIVGSETLTEVKELARLSRDFGERIVFSLDLKKGSLLTHVESWQSLNPFDVAIQVLGLGVRQIIILDLAKVGESGGVGTESLCQKLRGHAPEAMLISGGGVRGTEDLDSLKRAGCNAALVASALHDRRITLANNYGVADL